MSEFFDEWKKTDDFASVVEFIKNATDEEPIISALEHVFNLAINKANKSLTR